MDIKWGKKTLSSIYGNAKDTNAQIHLVSLLNTSIVFRMKTKQSQKT